MAGVPPAFSFKAADTAASTVYGDRGTTVSRLRADPAQITLGRSHDCCFRIGENVRLPPATVDVIEREWVDSFDDAADRRGSERNDIWITSHKADVTPVLHDGNDVTREQGTFAIGTCRPVQHGAAFKMAPAID